MACGLIRRNRVETKQKRKPGGGRKPKQATILKRQLIENKVEEADASFAFLVTVRDNNRWPKSLRLEAAKEILDRVLGKPKQATENEVGEETRKLLREFYALAYSGKAGDMAASWVSADTRGAGGA